MPKRKDLKKIMVIGSGPIVIGQGAEFDYAGTQACLALKEEGYEVILVNSNNRQRRQRPARAGPFPCPDRCIRTDGRGYPRSPPCQGWAAASQNRP